MATVKEVIIPAEKKKDGTWNVKIRVNHNGKTINLKTQHFIGEKQIRKDFTIKDPIILKILNPIIDDYRTKVSELGSKLTNYSLSQLVDYLTGVGIITAEEINVIAFGLAKIEELRKAKRNASAANMVTVINSLKDYFRSDNVPITEIRAKMLNSYEKYLRSARKITRLDQFGKPYERVVAGLSDTGLHNHMRDLRILFNTIKDHYNDDDLEVVIVKHYPFKKYKLVEVSENNKPKLTPEQVIKIRDFKAPANSRIEIAKDLFMLSFYLCGMNAIDLYKLEPANDLIDRIDYKRSKTESRRKDKAFISINIPDVARSIYTKYAGTLQTRFATHNTLDRSLSIGMRRMGKELKIENLEFYDARHAVGDWARNICRFSMDDVALTLNHKDQSKVVTDMYVSKNWDIIDEVQEAVLKCLNNTGFGQKKKKEKGWVG